MTLVGLTSQFSSNYLVFADVWDGEYGGNCDYLVLGSSCKDGALEIMVNGYQTLFGYLLSAHVGTRR